MRKAFDQEDHQRQLAQSSNTLNNFRLKRDLQTFTTQYVRVLKRTNTLDTARNWWKAMEKTQVCCGILKPVYQYAPQRLCIKSIRSCYEQQCLLVNWHGAYMAMPPAGWCDRQYRYGPKVTLLTHPLEQLSLQRFILIANFKMPGQQYLRKKWSIIWVIGGHRGTQQRQSRHHLLHNWSKPDVCKQESAC